MGFWPSLYQWEHSNHGLPLHHLQCFPRHVHLHLPLCTAEEGKSLFLHFGLVCVYKWLYSMPAMFMVIFLYRSIKSTASVSVIHTAAVVPPPPAPMAPWKTQACVLTTVTTAAAKPAMQLPTDRCGWASGQAYTHKKPRSPSSAHTNIMGPLFHISQTTVELQHYDLFQTNEKQIYLCGKMISLVFSGSQLVSVEWNEKINFHKSNDAIWPF